jgi:hypothetical protein
MSSSFDRLDNGPILFTAAIQAVSARGAASTTFDPVGASVKGYVSSKQLSAIQPDGLVMSSTLWQVWLFADPSTLNSGAGVVQDDGFLWNSLRLVAQGPPRPMRMGTRDKLWRVDCQVKA